MASTYKEGAKGSSVKKFQEMLNKAGAKPKLDINGKFDKTMTEVVRTFQKKNGLKVDGIIGKNTTMALSARGKAPKWPVRDVLKPIKALKNRKEEAQESWVEIAALAGKYHKEKDIKNAYRSYKIYTEAYVDYLRTFIKELEKIEEHRFAFEKTYAGQPAKQQVEASLAQDIFKNAEKMNKIANKLRRNHEFEHDNFLNVLDSVPAI